MGNNKGFEDLQSFSPEEIEQRSGFDRRTIAYYVQEGLLPRIGRRGPNTRYPKPFLDRLLFIKKLKELQDAGHMYPMSLSEMALLLERLPEQTIAAVASGDEPLDVVDYRVPGTVKMSPMQSRPKHLISDGDITHFKVLHSPARHVNEISNWPENKCETLAKMLSSLAKKARSSKYNSAKSTQPWLRTEVTADITLSVRGLDESDINKLEETAAALRQLIRDEDE